MVEVKCAVHMAHHLTMYLQRMHLQDTQVYDLRKRGMKQVIQGKGKIWPTA